MVLLGCLGGPSWLSRWSFCLSVLVVSVSLQLVPFVSGFLSLYLSVCLSVSLLAVYLSFISLLSDCICLSPCCLFVSVYISVVDDDVSLYG